MKRLVEVAFVLAIVAAGSLTAFSQEKAAVSGTVSDPKGAVIAGAKVVVKNVGTGYTCETSTNDTGASTRRRSCDNLTAKSPFQAALWNSRP